MTRRTLAWLGSSAIVLLIGGGLFMAVRSPEVPGTSERADAHGFEADEGRIQPSHLDLLQDDRLEDKSPEFNPVLVDSRPLATPSGPWEINASDAVIRLDIAKPRANDVVLLDLFPSYAAAAAKLRGSGVIVLPSINALDGKAKQFDDGLMAAVVAATASTQSRIEGRAPGLLTRLLGKLPAGSSAYAWVFAALETGNYLSAEQRERRPAAAAKLIEAFGASDEAKPISFYTWSPDLERLWRFYKFLQKPLGGDIPSALRSAIVSDPSLQRDYRRLLAFIAQLSNHPAHQSLLTAEGVHFLTPMGTKEDALFLKLFGQSGVPPGVELMQVFVEAIRSGEVDLKPGEKSGWYDYQVHALETFLLPERGSESPKLVLTKRYKQRMLEAFKAVLTKRRETHALFAKAAPAGLPPPQTKPVVSPRLRLEPNPTYYLRMARSYAFIERALEAFFPEEERREVFGLRDGGTRASPLMQELAHIKTYFYGLHLVSAEDIGLCPGVLPGELADPVAAVAMAERSLGNWEKDPDLAVDTRVCVPVSTQNDRYRLWCTVGVKAIRLLHAYERAPQGRPQGSQGEWIRLDAGPARAHVLLVDEFAEVDATKLLNRAELRAVADRAKTRERIIEALSK